MNDSGKVTVSLTGGLGNQFFQLAAGLQISQNQTLYLTSAFGKPRLNSTGNAELFSFYLPNKVVKSEIKYAPRFICKITGYLLRVGIAPRGFEKSNLFISVLKKFFDLVVSLYLKEKTTLVYLKNIGFSALKISKSSNLVIGYFQSDHWVKDSKIRKQMMSISIKNSSESLKYYASLSLKEIPLIVHMRFGDYLEESKFGIPSKSYYLNGIKTLIAGKNFSKIWLFSDDLEMAMKQIPIIDGLPIRTFESIQDSTALTFEVMRLGHGYVIANSTFSWWAAYLSKNPRAQVIAPLPWFKEMQEPNNLVPKKWTRIDSN